MSREVVFQTIEETREVLGDNWEEHWLKVLKLEVIVAYLLWLEGKKSK